LGPQKSRQNGQLAFESGGATSESGGTCPLPNVEPRLYEYQLGEMLSFVQVQEQCVFSGLLSVLAKLLSTVDIEMVVVTHSATILTKLSGARCFPEEVQKHAVYAALVCAINNAQSYDVLTEVCKTVSETSSSLAY